MSCSAENGKIGALRPAASENHLAWFAAQYLGGIIARLIQNCARAAADLMHARRVSPNLAQKRQHGLTYHRVQWCGGVIIEINRAHVHEEKPGGGSAFFAKRAFGRAAAGVC